jgi:ubiquinone/menaquinone biosynthesis C-methylase UbiE
MITTSVHEYSGRIPKNYDRYLAPFMLEPYAQDLAGRIGMKPQQKILELASGSGRVTRHLLERLGPGASLIASDINPFMLGYASRVLPPHPELSFERVDAVQLPYEDNSFDAVICQFGWMFFTDRARAFQEARRVLKPGGVLLFNTWDQLQYNDYFRAAQMALRKFFPLHKFSFFDTVFGYYDAETILRHMISAGFRDYTLETMRILGRAQDASAAARGMLLGTPLSHEVRDRAMPLLIPSIQRELTRVLARQYGEHNTQARMQALIGAAWK